jgi:nitroimidazol reductase NimA-like FMN-containing flavoprotein (pyridoxamine 5'-phosphate oxidase superfamily)
MNSQFRIKNKELIDKILDNNEYGTLALCKDNIPYSVPLNFSILNDCIYFHGAKKGKKVDIIEANANASFSVVENYSLIQSYFSTKDNLACPATHFFKSIIVQGKIQFVSDYEEKADALESLMQKLQPEGKYIPLKDKDVYEKKINGVLVYKLVIDNIEGKIKLGQNLNDERFKMVLSHLKQRGTDLDLLTVKEMEKANE